MSDGDFHHALRSTQAQSPSSVMRPSAAFDRSERFDDFRTASIRRLPRAAILTSTGLDSCLRPTKSERRPL
jgi:hypothetical protein